jgi:hypothetical protein
MMNGTSDLGRGFWRLFRLEIVCAAFAVCGFGSTGIMADDNHSDFARDVLPILKRSCFDCHDAEKQKGGLRLDSRLAAFKGGDGGNVIVPGKPTASELLRRVQLPEDDSEAMPKRGQRLSNDEIARLQHWIAHGAAWPETIDRTSHWAYQKPVRVPVPVPKNVAWPKNNLDRFVLQRLEQEDWQPSPEADRATLIRRVSLDLIGLPPSIAEVDAFLNDGRDDAYERVVDRLLESPLFGEKWARPWLDLARYADSHGFQRDDLREIWPYRDWVIRALNADMPFDRFTVEQIAGDLLPDAAISQRVATGFGRCSTTNVEAGSDPEETRVNQVFDRVNTTGTIWMGTTLECAQCHDHKYDPFSQQDYYRLFAFFNSTAIEADRTNPMVPGSIKFLGPSIPLADPVDDSEQSPWPINDPQELDQTVEGSLAQNAKLDPPLRTLEPPTTLVMRELDTPRASHVFLRGNYLDVGESVEPGVPAVLHSLPGGPLNRLTLGRWLVSRDNPLAARVTVNRWWAEFFGHGLVGTVEDFGVKGDPPTHPELLDWMAVEFMDHDWSMKDCLRTVVTSATYRQSSRISPAQRERDPENKLYSRGPRLRLDAETIRDNALAIAGLLSLKMNGAPIRPYQPDGLWTKIGGDKIDYVVSPGEDRYRRGIYVVWKRSSPYPSFVNFDAPARLACVPKRSHSNTPLQALTLLNDPVYVEAAFSLAKRIVVECPEAKGTAERIEYAVRLCLCRRPTNSESATLVRLYNVQLEAWRKQQDAVWPLIASGDVPQHLPAEEFGAWYSIAATLLNLDETITKE